MKRVLTALPVYNEEKHLLEVLPQVQKYAQDVLVVNDGSSDRTGEILKTIPGIQVLTHEKNSGYGAALCSAFTYAIEHGYNAIVTIDCDGQHQPALIPQMAEALFANDSNPDESNIDIISGSRYLKAFDGDSIPPEQRRAINVQITRQLNQLLGFRLTDTFCGFKAYRVESLKDYKITVFGYAMPLQFWIQAAHLGATIQEFPVPLIYLDEKRSFGGSLDDAKIRMAHYQEVISEELAALEDGSRFAEAPCRCC